MTIPNLAQGWQLAAEFGSDYFQDGYTCYRDVFGFIRCYYY
jgi:hypothetical protein